MAMWTRGTVLGGLLLSLLGGALPAVAQLGALARGGIHLSDSCASENVTTLLCWAGPGTPLYCGDLFYEPCATPEAGLQGTFDLGNFITNATPAKQFEVGLAGYGKYVCATDQTTGPYCRFVDGSGNFLTSADVIYSGSPKYRIHHTTSGDFTCETVDDTTLSITYANYQSCRPVKSVYISAGSMSVSGTCTDTAPKEETLLASGPKTYTITPADDNTCSVEFDVVMPDAWDGGTITLEQHVFATANANGDVTELDYACQCVRSGDTIAAHSTTGEQAATCTHSNAANKENHCTTSAITLQGTCAAGAHVYCRGQVDATATTVTAQAITTKRLLGVKLEYAISTNTDN